MSVHKNTMKKTQKGGKCVPLNPASYTTSGGSKRKMARKSPKRKLSKRHHKKGGLSSQLVPLGLLTGLLSMGPKRKSRKSRKHRKSRK